MKIFHTEEAEDGANTNKKPRLSLNKRGFWNVSSSTPGKIRTPNLLIRSQTLYPVELRAHIFERKVNISLRWLNNNRQF